MLLANEPSIYNRENKWAVSALIIKSPALIKRCQTYLFLEGGHVLYVLALQSRCRTTTANLPPPLYWTILWNTSPVQWTIWILSFRPVHLQLVSISTSWPPHAHAPTRQIRRPLVHDSNITCIIYRNCLVFTIFLLSPPMPAALRASHEAERYSHDTCPIS